MLWECTGAIGYRGQAATKQDIENFKAALATTKVAEAFLPVAAPLSARGLWLNSHYPNEDAVMTALADALKEEYRAIIDAGILISSTMPFWLTSTTVCWRDEPKEVHKYCEGRIDLLNYALTGIPEDRVRYHVCWGSWNAPHTTDVPLKTLVDLILKVRAQAYSLEAANPRHEHEWQVWTDVKLPDGKILIPGVVTHSTNVVEHPRLFLAHQELRQPGRPRERHCRHRLRLLPELQRGACPSDGSVGETEIARRGSTARIARIMGALTMARVRRTTAAVGSARKRRGRLPHSGCLAPRPWHSIRMRLGDRSHSSDRRRIRRR